jgi:hypothetical protein
MAGILTLAGASAAATSAIMKADFTAATRSTAVEASMAMQAVEGSMVAAGSTVEVDSMAVAATAEAAGKVSP